MLFEVAPDYFPEGYATDVELVLWGFYFEEKKERQDANRKR
jgi:hypothetical protein